MEQSVLEAFIRTKREEGLSRQGELQLQYAQMMGLEDRVIRLMADITLPVKVREWIYISALEGLPFDFLSRISTLNEDEIVKQRQVYLTGAKEVEHIKEQFKKAEKSWEEKAKGLEKNAEELRASCGELQKKLEEKHTSYKGLQEELEKAHADCSKLQKELEESHANCSQLQKKLEEKETNSRQPIEEQSMAVHSPAWYYGILERKKKKKILAILQKEKWNDEQRDFLIRSFELGVRPEVIDQIAIPGIKVEHMERIRNLLVKGGTDHE